MEDRSLPAVPPDEELSADALLLEQIRGGDADAAHRFVRDHYPGIYRHLLYLTGSRELAEDLSQETFLQAWRHLDRFVARAPLRAWLHRIAHREFLQALRSQRPMASLDQIAEPAGSLAAELAEAVELRDVIGKLPVEEREAVVLRHLEGYTCEEIAPIMGVAVRTVKRRLAAAKARLQQELGEGDLPYLNPSPAAVLRQWDWLPLGALTSLESRLSLVTTATRNGEHRMEDPIRAGMSRRKLLETAGTAAAAVAAASLAGPAAALPRNEAEVIDERLTRKVTLAVKAMALADLCEQLRADTGIHLAAGPSVADEKVTVFCEKQPLRDMMRQLSRPFGYTWLRSGQAPGARRQAPEKPTADPNTPYRIPNTDYRYELVQDLKSQLIEEELRNRDRNQALLALNQEMEKYRPYLDLSPDEALARLKTARPEEKKLLEQIANNLGGWGPLQTYFRLSPSEMASLRTGQRLKFRQDPEPGDRPLPAELRRGIFQSWRNTRLVRRADGFDGTGKEDPQGLPLSAVPEARAWLFLVLEQSQLGEYVLSGASGYYTPLTKETPRQAMSLDGSGPLAVGRSPEVLQPENARVNARFARDPALQARVTVQPQPSCRPAPAEAPLLTPVKEQEGSAGRPEPKVTSADLLEALHQATGMPIIADFYTRLYPAAVVTGSNQTTFEALNHLSDAMRLRWNKDAGTREAGAWLQFRSLTFYDDRRKEVPNRLLKRWQSSRRQHGTLTLEDLIEIAQLPEEQLQATDMAEGARQCWGLAEWTIFRNPVRHPYWRYLGEFTPAQRQQMQSPTGLPFTQMTLAQQQRYLAVGLEWDSEPLQSLEELAGASLRVDYTVPGGFEWQPPGPRWTRYVVPFEPGQAGRRIPRAPARGKTREEALEAARRLFPSVREPLLQANRRSDPGFDEAQLTPRESQIVPTRLLLEMVHVPGASNKRRLHVVTTEGMGWEDTW